MNKAEKKIEMSNRVKSTIWNRIVQRKIYKGIGFLNTGTTKFIKERSHLT
ncbi:hypothetical protein [Thermoanaerobacter thermohydrosulfuricus]|nr:hypothetical protein [Thermoanaerobacter thermohydrosulfuricus]